METSGGIAGSERYDNHQVAFQPAHRLDQPAVVLHSEPRTGVPTVHGNGLHPAHENLQIREGSSNPSRTFLQPAAGDAPVVIPLSSVPLGALPDLPADGSNRDSSKKPSKGDDLSVSTKTGTSGTSKLRSNLEDAALRVNHPKQVTSESTFRRKALAWVGRIGWVGKAVVYAIIGGLACQAAAVGHDATSDPNVGQQGQINASPQGAFVLLVTTPGGSGVGVLIVMMLALLCYIAWRFSEAFLGQGYDRGFSSKKNFFKFRVSPFVSGAVYCSYLVFILQLLHTQVTDAPEGPAKETWPATWRHSGIGKAGLALLGLAFLIATCIQLQGVLSKQWHKDYRQEAPRWIMRIVFTFGHFGFAGRGAAFLAMAIMFIKMVADADVSYTSSMVANALQQLQASRGLRAVLMIIGILLITYGTFAVMSSWARQFPTPSPSRQRVVPAAQLTDIDEEDEDDDDDTDGKGRAGRDLEMQRQQQPAGQVQVVADAV